MNTMVIGIAGGTGSGKTTVTEKLQEYFGADWPSVDIGRNADLLGELPLSPEAITAIMGGNAKQLLKL